MLCERFENFAHETELVGRERVSAFNSRCDEFIQIATNSPGTQVYSLYWNILLYIRNGNDSYPNSLHTHSNQSQFVQLDTLPIDITVQTEDECISVSIKLYFPQIL